MPVPVSDAWGAPRMPTHSLFTVLTQGLFSLGTRFSHSVLVPAKQSRSSPPSRDVSTVLILHHSQRRGVDFELLYSYHSPPPLPPLLVLYLPLNYSSPLHHLLVLVHGESANVLTQASSWLHDRCSITPTAFPPRVHLRPIPRSLDLSAAFVPLTPRRMSLS